MNNEKILQAYEEKMKELYDRYVEALSDMPDDKVMSLGEAYVTAIKTSMSFSIDSGKYILSEILLQLE